MRSTSRWACLSCAPPPTTAPPSISQAPARPIRPASSQRSSLRRGLPQPTNASSEGLPRRAHDPGQWGPVFGNHTQSQGVMSRPSELPPLRDVIRRHRLVAKKSLGQNFLLDLNLTGRIARAAGPLEGVTVVEVGPGPGGLTRALLAEGAGRVVAVERDRRAIAALAEIAERCPGRLVVV